MDNIWSIVIVQGAIYKEDKWLMIKRSENEEHAPGIISFVGGKLENKGDEQDVLEKTLKREIMEEVGIEISNDIRYIESKSFVSDGGDPIVEVIFLCRYKSGQPYCADTDEVAEIYWMSIDEIIRNEKTPIWVKEGIQKAEQLRLNIIA
ncbi:NUDIX hydrolase [Brassicibacter mesophilus]|uniref:NUDIX hydrolase n=1 Tax=Brassicibacter mesophilus TaxID=745119 RepID=UPI003D24519C